MTTVMGCACGFEDNGDDFTVRGLRGLRGCGLGLRVLCCEDNDGIGSDRDGVFFCAHERL